MISLNLVMVLFFIVLAGIVSVEIAVPVTILELIAGILTHNILRIQQMTDLEIFAKLGIICLMYLAGLEIDLRLMKKNIRSSGVIGFFSFAVPFTLVAIVSRLFLGFTLDQTILAGIALSTTSVAIVYPLLLKNNILDEVGKRMLSAAMVTDFLSMVALSLFFSHFTYFTVVLVGGMFVFTYLVPVFGKRILKYYRGNPVELEFRIVLFLMMGLAIASESAGVESALIAFIMGMVTSKVIVNHSDLQDKFKFLVFGFFGPIFFFTIGLTIELGTIAQSIPMFLVLLATCYIGKYVGTYVPARRYMKECAARMGQLFNARLSLGIIAATFGYTAGIFGQEIYSPLIGVIGTAAVISALLTKSRECNA